VLAAYRANVRAALDVPSIFSLYSAAIIDVSFLSMLEFDRDGNVNLHYYGKTLVGPGGSMDIAEAVKRVVFCGTLRAVGLEIRAGDGRLEIVREGAVPRGVEKVQAISFNGKRMLRQGKSVLYVTERAVFRLTEDGPMLIEVAPGVEVERDVLGQMDFRPRVSPNLRMMDPGIFRPGAVGLRRRWETEGAVAPAAVATARP